MDKRNMNTRHYVTLDELFDYLSGRKRGWTLQEPETQPSTSTDSSNEPDASTETQTAGAETQSVGSIYSIESLEQAIAQNEAEINDATAAFQRSIATKNAEITALKEKLEKEKAKTRMTRKGSDVAITMTRAAAETLLQDLGNLLNGSTAENVTFNISNVG